jgi:hypothetical protein
MPRPRLNTQVFLDVADAIRMVAQSDLITEAEFRGISAAAHNIAAKFAERAQSFDRELFLRNCGVQ